MIRTVRKLATLSIALSLAACGGQGDDTSAPPAEASGPAATVTVATTGPQAPAAFAQCRSCHAVEAGKNGVGPSLFGVFGTKAGSVAGYAYTDANKNSGLTWDEATLDEYLTAPMKKIPGTKMTYAGMPDAAKRKDVIEYLKSLK
jgi:cytochrome c